MKLKDDFEQFRAINSLTEGNRIQFLEYIHNPEETVTAQVTVSALSLSLLEKGFNKDIFELLLSAYDSKNQLCINERIIVSILLVMIQYDEIIRNDIELLNKIQDVFTNDESLSFTALCNIARTRQTEALGNLQQKLSAHLKSSQQFNFPQQLEDIMKNSLPDVLQVIQNKADQNMELFRGIYENDSFFKLHAMNWLIPWEDHFLSTVSPTVRDIIKPIIETWFLCDSDKYALTRLIDRGSDETLKKDAAYFKKMSEMNISTNAQEITMSYVQQTFRFFTLSSHTEANPYRRIKDLNQLIAYRLIVVGTAPKRAIDKLLQV